MSRDTKVVTALFGGSFDPPHCAHLMAVAYTLACTECEEAWVVPCYRHAFGKVTAAFEDRLAMCRAAFSIFGPVVRVLDVERRLPVPSFTINTLRHLAGRHPERVFRLVVGSDVMAETGAWREFGEVSRLAPPLVLRRDGAPDHPGARGPVFPDVSSTGIRAAIAAGADVADLVPRDVLSLILERGIYRGG